MVRNVWIVEFLRKTFEGRGIYPTFFSIISWIYVFVIVLVLLCQFCLYIFGMRYNSPDFSKDISKEQDKRE
ncbi:MAG: hypothetical protein Q8936_17325 [Bacillota bacterium]|nr:hypothetical protein [Bacillota bacterium]